MDEKVFLEKIIAIAQAERGEYDRIEQLEYFFTLLFYTGLSAECLVQLKRGDLKETKDYFVFTGYNQKHRASRHLTIGSSVSKKKHRFAKPNEKIALAFERANTASFVFGQAFPSLCEAGINRVRIGNSQVREYPRFGRRLDWHARKWFGCSVSKIKASKEVLARREKGVPLTPGQLWSFVLNQSAFCVLTGK